MPVRKYSSLELAFLAAIHADPRDDALRLIFADWLEEQGNALGELIRWQIVTRRRVDVYIGRSEIRFAGIHEPRQGETVSPQAASLPFNNKWFSSVILPEANKWLRPFPRECRHRIPQVCFERGLPCVEWSVRSVEHLSLLEGILQRLRPHFRVNGLILPLDRMQMKIDAVLRHPALARVNCLSVPINCGPEPLREFIAHLADTDLPNRIERLYFLGVRNASASVIAIRDHALAILGQRMRVT